MTAPFLMTKLSPPPLSARHIPRARARAQLEAHSDGRLVLVSAPAGFGKTTFLAAWARFERERGTRVAWYALDSSDNDPARFAGYLIEAARRALEPDTAALPSGAGPAEIESAVALLLNALANQPDRLLFVFDDYHLITAPAIHHGLNWMLEHLPANVQIAIGSRADPPLQLARLRARGQMTEIRTRDLRFYAAEIRAFLDAALQTTITDHDVHTLEAATEGWAAALQLIALSLDHSRGPDDRVVIADALARFSQAQQHIFDYFAEEVFGQQPAETQQFLLDTCILNQLSPEVCAAVTGRPDAPLLLEHVARASLFLIALSSTEPVYRYHHLFEDFLRARLARQPERLQALQRLAADWHAREGSISQAVDHALAAADFDQAARLIVERAWEALTARGEIMTILNWLPVFPETALARFPRLCLCFSRAFYLTGNMGQSEAYLKMAADALERPDLGDADLDALRAVIGSYGATLAAYRGDVEHGFALIAGAQPYLQALEPIAQARWHNTLGYLHFLKGEIEPARAAYQQALAITQALEHHYLLLDSAAYLAQITIAAGQLHAGREWCEALLARYDQPIAPLCVLLLPLAQITYEQGQVERGRALLDQAIRLAREGSIPDLLWSAYVLLALVEAAHGRAHDAEAALQTAAGLIKGFQSPVMLSMLSAARARVLLADSNRLNEAAAWAEDYQQAGAAPYLRAFEDLTLARVWTALGRFEEALALLADVTRAAQSAGRLDHAIHAQILTALALQAAGKPDSAAGALEPALTLAAPEGYVRAFADHGAALQPVLRRLMASLRRRDEDSLLIAYAEALLSAAQVSAKGGASADALSEREREVLGLLAQGATNQDIADALVISLGTVKSHLNHIMGKLGARNRTEAVAKGRELHLLD